MLTRRDFGKTIGAAAGIAFCGCPLLDAARAQQSGGQRLPVTVNGKRVKTIDVHAHCLFPEAVALMGADPPPRRLAPPACGRLESAGGAAL